MASAVFHTTESERLSDQIYQLDVSSKELISSTPLLRDPYEDSRVYVSESKIGKHAGQGLFAKRSLPAEVRPS